MNVDDSGDRSMLYDRKSTNRWLLCLLVIQATLLVIIAWQTGPGWDEWGHLPSGLFNLQYGDFHPYQVNPPLVRLISAIPVAILGGGIEFAMLPKSPGFRSEGYLGMAYVHQQGPSLFFWISIARTAVIPIALFGTWLLYKIGSHFGGRRTGLLAAALWVFSPTILAYGGTITPDAAAAVFGFWAAWCFYCWIRLGRTEDAIWMGISVGVALLSKSTWIILPPVLFAMLVGLQRFSKSRIGLRKRWVQFGLASVIAWLLVHAVYDFRGAFRPLGSFEFISETLSGNNNSSIATAPITGNRFAGTPLAWMPALIPSAYVEGIDVQKRDFELTDMRSYLLGKWGERGWWHYYAVAWFVKEPLAFWFILLFGWSAVCGQRQRRSRSKRLGIVVLLVPGILVFCFVSSQTGFNHHLRYVLPAFPAMFLLAALPMAHVGIRMRRTILVLLAWFAVSSLVLVPRSYAYFSEAVGGWRQGHRYLNASNLDWGQDLLAIRKWTRDNPDKRPVHLLYSPSQLDFRRLGIDATIAEGRVSDDGPIEDGWWIVSIDRLLTPPNSWFLEQNPTERLSVSTTIYQIRRGRVVSD